MKTILLLAGYLFSLWIVPCIYAKEDISVSANKSTAVRLEIVGNKANVIKNGKRMLKVTLNPEQDFKNKHVKDMAVLVANCLVVARGLTYIKGDNLDGGSPIAKSIEVYTLSGMRKVYPGGLFYGQQRSAPSGSWGVIVYNGECGAEGDVCGYYIVKSDGFLKNYRFTNPLKFTDKSESGLSFTEDLFSVPTDGADTLEIKPDGSQRIVTDNDGVGQIVPRTN